MKKSLAAWIAVSILILFVSGCQYNLFAPFDQFDIPSSAEMNDKAASDPDGFVSDVEEYDESNSITEDDADDIVAALDIVYTNEGDTETGEKAAVLAGAIIITSDPDTSAVVNNIVGAVMDAADGGTDITPESLVSSIFPDDMTQSDLTNMLDDLQTAADAYADLAGNLATGADWMSDSEIMDMTQLAVVSLVVSDIRQQITSEVYSGDQAAADAFILEVIKGTADFSSVPTLDNPLDSSDASVYETQINQIITFSGLTDLLS